VSKKVAKTKNAFDAETAQKMMEVQCLECLGFGLPRNTRGKQGDRTIAVRVSPRVDAAL